MTAQFDKTHFDHLWSTDPHFVNYVSRYRSTRFGADARECPPLASLVVLLATYFDNGEPAPKTAGRSRNRHAIQFQGWTDLDGLDLKSPDWKINVALNNGNDTIRLVARQLANGSISQEYHDLILKAVASCGHECLYGQFFHLATGQTYFDRQFCIFRLDGGQPSFLGIVNGDLATMLRPAPGEGWVPTYPKGEVLKGTAKYQLRWDITGGFAGTAGNWPTL